MSHQDTLASLVSQLTAGKISRRDFLVRGSALGVGGMMLCFFIRNAQTVGAAPHPQDATSAAAPPPPAPAGPGVGEPSHRRTTGSRGAGPRGWRA